MQTIQALRFDVEDVGKHVKGSKKRYCWDFSLNGRAHSLVLDFSFISGKVKITVDRKILLENDLPADVSFQYPFKLDGFALNIIQQGDSFELRINNKVFSHLYTQQRTNAEFKKYEDEVKDIKVDLSHLNPQNKKISLNIGAFGGNIKKKKEATDSQSWNAFAGGSFPSYFADNEPQNANKPKPQQQGSLLQEQEEAAEKTANQFSLLQNSTVVVEAKKQQNIFDMMSSEPEKQTVNTSKQFTNMQDMFNSLSVSNNKNNEVDFFADAPSPSTISNKKDSEIKAPASSAMFDFGQSSIGLSGFATGFGVQANPQPNQKSFATISNTGNKGFDLSSLDLSVNAPKQQAPISFKKQENLTYNQLDSAFQPISKPSNDFASMQNMFQSPAFTNNSQDFTLTQTQSTQKQVFATNNQGLQFDFGLQSSKGDQFNTMPNMYQNKGASQGFGQLNLNLNVEQPPKANPLDMFSNNKPTSFATLSGGNNNNLNFDMSSFGTMQAKPKGNTGGELDFFDLKGSKPSASSGDLI